jgi:predicted dehydrogenase
MTSFEIKQSVVLPSNPPPIMSIGLGGIVHDAHYPAYKIAGFNVIGGYDLDPNRAKMMKDKFSIPTIYSSIKELVKDAPHDVIYDVAVPGNAVLDVLRQLPDGSAVLIQKPMGENLVQAEVLLLLSREKGFAAATNFQLRYAPFIIVARDMIKRGFIGELFDLEAQIQVTTPWQLWNFLYPLPRVEILYHSIHYVDLMRSFVGNPSRVYAKTINHPLASNIIGGTRSTIIMDYGDNPRVNISTNHNHQYGTDNQQSYFKFEGSKGAIKITAGLLMNYPDGLPDKFEYILLDENDAGWQTLDIGGSWFPEAFIGTMSSLMQYVNGETTELPTSIEDAIHTMAAVEAAYASSKSGGTSVKSGW